MTDNLTLIESDVLDELIERAFAFDQIMNEKKKITSVDWKQVAIDKANFLSKYITVNFDFNKNIVDGLEKRGYE